MTPTLNSLRYSGLIMQPSPYDQPVMQPSPYAQPVMIDPLTGMPSNVIIVQQPSGAPTVMGILIIIYGSLGILSSIAGMFGGALLSGIAPDPETEALYDDVLTLIIVVSVIGLITSIGYIISGIWMKNRQTRGVHLCLIIIGLEFLVSVTTSIMFPELAEFNNSTVGMDIAFSGVGSIFCGVLAAIPLMVTNSGMDGSRLF